MSKCENTDIGSVFVKRSLLNPSYSMTDPRDDFEVIARVPVVISKPHLGLVVNQLHVTIWSIKDH